MPAGRLALVCGWLVAAAPFLFATAASADESFTARKAITLPGTQKVTSFDISFVDPVIGLYLLADRTNKVVHVIDTTTNSVLAELTATPPFAASQAKTPGTGIAERSISTPRFFGRTRGKLSRKPPPVICAKALTPSVSANTRRIGFT